MKVAWLHNFDPNIKGAGSFMYILYEELCQRNVDIDLIYLGNLRSIKNLITAPSKELIAKVAKYDILHAQFGSACGYICSKLPGKKIVTLRGSDWYGRTSGTLLERCHGVMQRRLTKLSLKRVSEIIVVAERMKSEVAKLYNKNIYTIPDGIDLSNFKPMQQQRARGLLNCPDDNSFWVLFPTFCADNTIKRPNLAQAAFAEAKKAMPRLVFKMFSGVPHEKMPLLYNASNVILMTSTHEGWPNTIKEALACNVPFVSTDVSDLSLIAAQEESCKVVEANPVALAGALVEVAQMKQKYNLCKYAQQFDIKVIANKLIDVYEKMLSV